MIDAKTCRKEFNNGDLSIINTVCSTLIYYIDRHLDDSIRARDIDYTNIVHLDNIWSTCTDVKYSNHKIIDYDVKTTLEANGFKKIKLKYKTKINDLGVEIITAITVKFDIGMGK